MKAMDRNGKESNRSKI